VKKLRRRDTEREETVVLHPCDLSGIAIVMDGGRRTARVPLSKDDSKNAVA